MEDSDTDNSAAQAGTQTTSPNDVHGTLIPQHKPNQKGSVTDIFRGMETMWDVSKRHTNQTK